MSMHGDILCPTVDVSESLLDKVHRRILDALSRLLTEIIALHCLWWLGQVVCMLSHGLRFRALFAHAGRC